jgi:peroxiredoxin
MMRFFIIFSLLFSFLNNISAAELKVGDIAPDFEIKDINGNYVTLNKILSDRPLILSFFGTWCDLCLKEIKDLSKIAQEYNTDVYIVGLDKSKDKIDKFVKKNEINFPVLWDPSAEALGEKYNLIRGAFLIVPKMVIISPKGTIEYISESYSKEKEILLKKTLTEIKSKKWDKPTEIAVFFTNSINGYLESCNCYKHPYGGLVKFASWFKQQKLIYKNHILLDSGDFLPHSVSKTSAEFIFKAIEICKYDAIAIGDQDIYYPDILEVAKSKRFPFISSNLMWCNTLNPPLDTGAVGISSSDKEEKEKGLGEKDCKLISAFDKVITLNGIKIKIISYIHPDSFFLYPEDFTNKIKIKELTEILKPQKDANFLILLSHSGVDNDKKIAEKFDKINLIIGGHSSVRRESSVCRENCSQI